MKLSEHIRSYRGEKGLTQLQLSELMGTMLRTVQLYESGIYDENPTKANKVKKQIASIVPSKSKPAKPPPPRSHRNRTAAGVVGGERRSHILAERENSNA